ncbi:MAG TPA: ABC transporter substrate-binding protein [Actinomycetota bacterium]|nr:ABC transporter substrate-binding protein [Actinomycetota bacterium]
MRKILATLAVSGLFLAACADDQPSVTPPTATGSEACAKENLPLLTRGQLTIATDDPSFPPWIIKNDPTNGKGFEGALAYEVAERLGFSASEVEWVIEPFNKSYAPGPKDFDFDINNISVTEEREQAVDFSDGYYDLTQALLVLEGSPLEGATTLTEVKDYVYGAQVGTTSLTFINTVIQPSQQAKVFDTTSDAKSALKNGSVDGLILDLPTAYYEATIGTKGSALVGQFPSTGEHLGLLFEEGNPLRDCVNEVLADMKGDGTLSTLQDEWLADYLAVLVIQ